MSPSQAVGLDVGAVQAALAADGIDGWLLYDFRGLNPLATDVTGVGRQGGHLATRRWYYLIPASGEPRALVHKIEKHSLAHLPGTTAAYAAVVPGRCASECFSILCTRPRGSPLAGIR